MSSAVLVELTAATGRQVAGDFESLDPQDATRAKPFSVSAHEAQP